MTSFDHHHAIAVIVIQFPMLFHMYKMHYRSMIGFFANMAITFVRIEIPIFTLFSSLLVVLVTKHKRQK